MSVFCLKIMLLLSILMAFTMLDVKMFIVVNVYRREHYQMSFVLKCSHKKCYKCVKSNWHSFLFNA